MKLIISDLDGTLLLKGEIKLHRLAVSAIEKIMDKGAIFCVASGRNYAELKRLLGNFDDKIYFIANDGALIVHKEETVYETPIDKAKLKLFDTEKNFVAHGKYLSFVKSDEARFVRQIKEQYFGHIVRIEGTNEIDEPIYKIALYGKTDKDFGLEKIYCDSSICEYTEKGINKGNAVSKLMEALKINRSDVTVIGDGLNDIEMLKLAGKSYVIASAPPKVKKIADCVIGEFKDVADNL